MVTSDQEAFDKLASELDYSRPVGMVIGEVGDALNSVSVTAQLSSDPERILDDAIKNLPEEASLVGDRSVGERDGMRFVSQAFEHSNASGTLQGTLTVIVNGKRMAIFIAGVTSEGADAYLPLVQATMDSVVVHSPPSPSESQVDLSTPERTLEAVFEAARTEDFASLAGLCDPLGENDRNTQKICDLAQERFKPFRESFVEYFSKGKINGEAVISPDGTTADVPFLFGPEGDREETMRLVNRNGSWYLLDYYSSFA